MSGLQILTCHPCDKHQYNTEEKKNDSSVKKRKSKENDKIVAQ